jgi:hypothetical protein
MTQRWARLTPALDEQVREAAKREGCKSIADFIRIALQNEVKRRQTGSLQIEREVGASLERHWQELKSLRSVLHAQFALLDAFTRVMLHCVPEPSADMRDQSVARAKERHLRLLKMAGINMKGVARAVLTELVDHEE